MQKIQRTTFRDELADGLFRDQHREKIERLREAHHHTIQPASHQILDLNCFAFAFDLIDAHSRELFAENKIYVDARFVTWLRATQRLTVIEDPAGQRCIALYYLIDGQRNQCKHAAIRESDGRMISKWGAYSIYEYALEEVPSNYGDDIVYVAKPSDAEARQQFTEYIKRCKRLPNWAQPFGTS